jgi:hypothetical protein
MKEKLRGRGRRQPVRFGRSSKVDISVNWQLDLVRRSVIVTGEPRHRAFPSLERLQNGDLLLVYREGSDHFKTLTGVARQVRSTDDGKTWSSPTTIWSKPGLDVSPDVGLCRLDGGSLLLPLLEVRDLHRNPRWITCTLLRSTDNANSWSSLPPPSVDGLSEDWWWNTYGKITQLADGTILWPIARQKRHEEFWRTGLLFSYDRGLTWTRYTDVAQGLADEKYVLPLSPRRLIVQIRDLKTPFLYQSYSNDNGLTWTAHKKTNLYGQAPCLFRTRKGVLLSTHRDIRPGRSGVALAYSFDEGESWQYARNLYESSDPGNRDCSYPTMVELKSREIMCAYYSPFHDQNSDIEAVCLNEA